MSRCKTILLMAAGACATFACTRPSTMMDFIRRTDAMPVAEQPPGWPEIRRLILRRAPAVGEAAPDFELQTADGAQTIRRSAFHEGRPLVLIFGSFT